MPIGLIIDLIKRFLPQIIGVAAALLALAYVIYRVDSGGYERAENKCKAEALELERKSEELLKLKLHEKEVKDKQMYERAENAIKIYAGHYASKQSDVDNLTRRMRNATSKANCGWNPMPGTGDYKEIREGQDNVSSKEIARTVIELANLCEMHINRLEVKN